MKKRLLQMFLLCLPLAVLLTVSAGAEVVKNGKCGDNLTWTLDDKGALIITGNGLMSNYNDPRGVNKFSPLPLKAG